MFQQPGRCACPGISRIGQVLAKFGVAVTLAGFAGLAFGQAQPVWQMVDDDERFAGPHAAISTQAVQGSLAGELRIGCPADDPRLPSLVLMTELELGSGLREVYTRVLGLGSTSRNDWTANGSEIGLAGLNSSLLLTEVAASPAARGLFLRVEGDGGGSWTVPLQGFREAFEALPCTSAFR